MTPPPRIRPQQLDFADKVRGLNWALVLLVPILGLVGYLVLYSAAGGAHAPWAWRHAVRLAFGTVAMLAIAFTDIRLIYRASYAIYAVCIFMLMAVDIAGTFSKGAQRWLDLGVVRLQPSEVVKVALVMALARYFHGLRLEEVRRPSALLAPLGMIGLPAVLVLGQPDLGTAVMLVAVGATVMFLAGVRLWKFLLAGAAVAAALPVIWANLHDYQRERVLTFLDPERDPLGAGYHILQSYIALGAGGIWGRGFLQGSQAQLDFLPEKQTDFAFALLGEETGFVGALVVLALYATVVAVAFAVALRAGHHFGRLLAAGLGVNFALYVVINVAMVAGLIPVVGVPLPFISYGGTAMFANLLGLGLILCVDVHRRLPLPRHPGDPLA